MSLGGIGRDTTGLGPAWNLVSPIPELFTKLDFRTGTDFDLEPANGF